MRFPSPLVLVLATLSLPACRCATGLTEVTPAVLVARPERLLLPDAFVGQRTSAVVTLSNLGGARAEVGPVIDGPFEVDATRLTLGSGEEVRLHVSFAPTVPGAATGTLRLGALDVPVEGLGLEVPACQAAAPCTEVHFDFERRQCLETTRADGAACESRCIRGSCSAGVCAGQLVGCETGDACLVPTCSEVTGCGSVPRTCPAPTSPCQVATCDATTGCGVTDAPDGTLCGPDDCLATQVDVCLLGQCVLRPRPATARCSNRWVPTALPLRYSTAMAWDGVRGQLLVFGGSTSGASHGDTWSFDGVRWEQRLPISSPSARDDHRMVWDAARRRVVLFGGHTTAPNAETWEWDGVTWLARSPPVSPPAVLRQDTMELAYDSVRRRVVQHGPTGTWEWDGVTWHHPAPATRPTAIRDFALAFDAARKRIVLFGGRISFSASDPIQSETWLWDGASWQRASPASSPPARVKSPMVWDPARQRVVLFGGFDGNGRRADTWEWDGVRWLERQPPTSPGPELADGAIAFDEARQRVVLFGGTPQRVWEWDGVTWRNASAPLRPPFRWETALASDTARNRLVLFGGRTLVDVDDTWEWDGARWAQRSPTTSPPARSSHALAFDPLRQRVVLFGGVSASGTLGDTWEWDGTTWTQRFPLTAPSARSGHRLAWNPGRQRIVLVGGSPANELWEWTAPRGSRSR